uniref:uncharacterized protein LOC131107876 n=1 Tax=Doryrhamphus excisus TaxID=161450 RepID=UPI0025AE75E9|nr:uncharacterized protein LOC131107876 [Doryrhamphus excisus]
MAEPPHPDSLSAAKQRFYSRFLSDDNASSHLTSKGEPSHPVGETHLGCLYLPSCPHGHDPTLMTLSECRNVVDLDTEETVKRSGCPQQKKEASFQRSDQTPSTPPPCPQPCSKTRKTVSEVNKAYRERVKADPQRYETHLAESRQRSKEYRDEIRTDEEKRRRSNEAARLRMARMRARKREQTLASGGPARLRTRKDCPARRRTRKDDKDQHKLREKWRLQKQKQREKWTPQKRARINMQKRNERAEKKRQEVVAGVCERAGSTQTQTEGNESGECITFGS